MASKEFTIDAPPAPCGNCGALLPPSSILKAFVYDHLYEVSDRVRSGDVNLCACPSCGYGGWFWPGFLVIDRSKRRFVFVWPDEFDPLFWTVLQQSLDLVQPSLGADIYESAKTRAVWVGNYGYIYELLCTDDDSYDAEAATYSAYRNRQAITDLTHRARQFLLDTVNCHVLLLRPSEGTPQFIGAVVKAMHQELAAPHPDEQLVLLRNLTEALEKIHDALPGARDEEKRLPSAVELIAESQLTDEFQRADIQLRFPSEICTQLDDILREASEVLKLRKNLGRRDPLDPYELLSTLLFPNTAHDSMSLDSSSEIPLNDCILLAVERAPRVQISHNNRLLSVSEAIRDAFKSGVGLVCLLGDIALGSLDQNQSPEFSIAMAALLAANASKDSSGASRFYALALCAECALRHSDITLALAAYGSAAFVFTVRDDEAIRIPAAILNTLAVIWQRFGRQLHSQDMIELSAMSSGIAANVFRYAGNELGEIRSRMDAISTNAYMRATPEVAQSAMGLLNRIRGRRVRSTDNEATVLVDSEIECLQLIGQILFSLSPERPALIELAVEYNLSDDRGTISPETTASVKWPLLFLEYTEILALSQEKLEHFLGKIVQFTSGKDGSKSSESKFQFGLVELTRVSLNPQGSYVAHAQINDVPWFMALADASRVAAKHQIWSRWFDTQVQIIERSRTFNSPSLTLYLYRLFIERSKMFGLGEPEPAVLATILPQVAVGLSEAGAIVVEETLRSLEFSRAINAALTYISDRRLPRGVTETWGLEIGEVFERLGRIEDSILAYQSSTAKAEQQHIKAMTPEYRNHLRYTIVTGNYRMARARLKHFMTSGDFRYVWDALSNINAYRVGALGHGDATTSEGFQSLCKVTPPGTVLLVYALLQATALNEGFWFITAINLDDHEILLADTNHLEVISDPFEAVEAAFEAARCSFDGRLPDSSTSSNTAVRPTVSQSLEALADVLIPPHLVELIEERRLTNLIFMPDAYLLDVPFAALRVRSPRGRVYPFELNPEIGGSCVSIAPNAATLQTAQNERIISPGNEFGAAIVTKPSWRRDLAPLYGLNRRLERPLSRLFEAAAGDGKVPPFVTRASTVAHFQRIVRECRAGLFVGHGEIVNNRGSVLVADDGFIGSAEIDGGGKFQSVCSLLVLCACSGVNSQPMLGFTKRELSGIHVGLVKKGVRFLIGSVAPMFPISALCLLESLVDGLQAGLNLNDTLRRAYTVFAADPDLQDPVFWGHIVGIGDGNFTLKNGKE